MNALKSSKRFINNNFHALTHKNFRYFWMGQCVSLIGTWMQNIGQSWLVLSLTGSPFLLGLLGTIQFIPITIFSLFAGVIVDKLPKKKILIATQAISMLLAFALSALVFTHSVKYGYILVLALLLGCTNTLDMPTRQSFVIEIAGKEDLMNAIALNSATFNLARIIGPAIGAMFMAYFGAGWCFLINGVSFIAVIYGLMQIKVNPYVRKKNIQGSIFTEINDGIKYILKNSILLQTVLMVVVVGIFLFNFNITVPVFTKSVLHQQEKTYGLLMSCLGAGSLVGALMVSMRSKSGPKTRVMITSSAAVSILLVLMGFSNKFYLAAIVLFMIGIFNIKFSTTANSTLQINSKDEYRGRVMSIYSLVFAGATPIGNMFAGFTADRMGGAYAFILSGILSISLIILITGTYIHKKIILKRTP